MRTTIRIKNFEDSTESRKSIAFSACLTGRCIAKCDASIQEKKAIFAHCCFKIWNASFAE